MNKEDSEPQKAEEGYGELTHIGEETEYGIRYPDGNAVFPSPTLHFYGVAPRELGTLEGQGKAQDNYLQTLKMNGVPITPELRLGFVKRKRVTSVTETIDLHTES